MHCFTSKHNEFLGRIASVLKSTVILVFLAGISFQAKSQYHLSEHVDQSKLESWAMEVYRDCPEYASSEHLEIYRKQIDKVVIHEVESLSEHYNLTNLHSVGLRNKCNDLLDFDTANNFTMEDFNPIKYFFDFYASEDKSYFVEGTNYIITIIK